LQKRKYLLTHKAQGSKTTRHEVAGNEGTKGGRQGLTKDT